MGLNRGKWNGKTILSDAWVKMATTPTATNPGYGFCNWFLNTDRKMYPAAREDSVSYIGDGANVIFIDYEHDMVAVVRWIDNKDKAEFVARLEASLKQTQPTAP